MICWKAGWCRVVQVPKWSRGNHTRHWNRCCSWRPLPGHVTLRRLPSLPPPGGRWRKSVRPRPPRRHSDPALTKNWKWCATSGNFRWRSPKSITTAESSLLPVAHASCSSPHVVAKWSFSCRVLTGEWKQIRDYQAEINSSLLVAVRFYKNVRLCVFY